VEEVNAAESACDERVHGLTEALNTNWGATANVGEYIALTQFDKSKLSVVRVSGVI